MAEQDKNAKEYEKQLLAAATADPWSIEPYQQLARRRLDAWKLSGAPETHNWRMLDDFELLTNGMLAADKNSSGLWSIAGQGWLEVFRDLPKQTNYGRLAVRCFVHAAAFYPNSATLQWQLAEGLIATSDVAAAKEAARRALQLDDLMPHADKKLSSEQRDELTRIISGGKSPR